MNTEEQSTPGEISHESRTTCPRLSHDLLLYVIIIIGPPTKEDLGPVFSVLSVRPSFRPSVSQSRCDVTEMLHKNCHTRTRDKMLVSHAVTSQKCHTRKIDEEMRDDENVTSKILWREKKEVQSSSFYCSIVSIVLLLGTPGQIFQSYNLIGYPMSPSPVPGMARKCDFFGFLSGQFGSDSY